MNDIESEEIDYKMAPKLNYTGQQLALSPDVKKKS